MKPISVAMATAMSFVLFVAGIVYLVATAALDTYRAFFQWLTRLSYRKFKVRSM